MKITNLDTKNTLYIQCCDNCGKAVCYIKGTLAEELHKSKY